VIGREVVRRLRAYEAGQPLPEGETIRLAIAPDPDLLVVAFVRVGGEARPWGIAYGHPHEQPKILTVPEGRNRDLVADMCAEFAPTLVRHLRSPAYLAETPSSWQDLAPLRQVWLPNGTHLDMLHHLAYAYTFTRWGAGARGRLNAFGRACGWLFREAQRPGEQHVRVATDALRTAYTFPAQDVRQGHLGFLLAWLDTEGSREDRIAAADAAEDLAVSTSLDPSLERSVAEPLVDKWTSARRDDDGTTMESAADEIAEVLNDELARRFSLAVRAIEVLRSDGRRTNTGIEALIREGLKEQWYQYTRLELNLNDDADGPAFTPSPETDRYPAAAGSRYQVHLASEDLAYSALLHDDVEMQSEAIAHGDAFRGKIVEVVDVGEGRATRPIWTIVDASPGQLRLREGSWVCVVGMPSRTAEIVSVDDQPDGSRIFVVEITGWKTIPKSAPAGTAAANDRRLVSTDVAFVQNSAEQINRRKSQRIWSADVPGSWLTHARPTGLRTVIDPEAAEELESIGPVHGV
jgi:hypothetical protein